MSRSLLKLKLVVFTHRQLRLRKPSERKDKGNVKTHRRVIVRLATAVRLKIGILVLPTFGGYRIEGRTGKIEGYTERRTQFIVPSISLANRCV